MGRTRWCVERTDKHSISIMCKCENVQMCKLSPLLAEFISALYYSHILTFAHLHISQAFSHKKISYVVTNRKYYHGQYK